MMHERAEGAGHGVVWVALAHEQVAVGEGLGVGLYRLFADDSMLALGCHGN